MGVHAGLSQSIPLRVARFIGHSLQLPCRPLPDKGQYQGPNLLVHRFEWAHQLVPGAGKRVQRLVFRAQGVVEGFCVTRLDGDIVLALQQQSGQRQLRPNATAHIRYLSHFVDSVGWHPRGSRQPGPNGGIVEV